MQSDGFSIGSVKKCWSYLPSVSTKIFLVLRFPTPDLLGRFHLLHFLCALPTFRVCGSIVCAYKWLYLRSKIGSFSKARSEEADNNEYTCRYIRIKVAVDVRN